MEQPPDEPTPEADALIAAMEPVRHARQRVRAATIELRDALRSEVVATLHLDAAKEAYNASHDPAPAGARCPDCGQPLADARPDGYALCLNVACPVIAHRPHTAVMGSYTERAPISERASA